jgi:hypothetical protein
MRILAETIKHFSMVASSKISFPDNHIFALELMFAFIGREIFRSKKTCHCCLCSDCLCHSAKIKVIFRANLLNLVQM